VSAPYVEPPRLKSNFQVMIEQQGTDQFLFGPPSGIEKIHGAHRDYVAPKIGTRMEMVAKKMREQYIREAIYPDVKIYLDPLRERQISDSLQKLHQDKEVAGLISARDEFDDLDLVFPHRTPFTITKADHGMVRPFFVRHKEEEIMVTTTKIERHFKT